ncbi:MAG: DEAD/DEAH box helicase, partial [Mycobacterium sp.]
MVALSDRLDYVIGAKSADPLDEVFGIRTVDDLLRHYPRSYVEGATMRGVDDERPPDGEHVTLVDEITEAVLLPIRNRPRDKLFRVTLGSGRGKVTATFFHPKKWIQNQLAKGTRVMLSGEVGYFRGAMQLTHPDFLVLDAADGRNRGSRSLRMIADASQAVSGEVLQEAFERSFYPIYPASTKVQSWDIFACVRQVLEMLDPVADPLPETLCAQHNLVSEDQALRAIHLAEDGAERRRARERLAFDEAVGLQWALVSRRHGELSQSGPAAPVRADGLQQELLQRLPFELTVGQREVLQVLSAEIGATRPMNRLLQGEVGSGKTIVSVLAMLQMVDAGYQCALLAPTEVLAAQHLR